MKDAFLERTRLVISNTEIKKALKDKLPQELVNNLTAKQLRLLKTTKLTEKNVLEILGLNNETMEFKNQSGNIKKLVNRAIKEHEKRKLEMPKITRWALMVWRMLTWGYAIPLVALMAILLYVNYSSILNLISSENTVRLSDEQKADAGSDFTNTLADYWGDRLDPRIRSIDATLNAIEVLKDKIKGKRITVLYPGAGTHVAPLDIAHELIKSGRINKARFFYTEIDEKYLKDFRSTLEALRHIGFYTSLSEVTKDFGGDGKEVVFKVIYSGKEITVLYALNRSGLDWWRTDYAQQTDIIYFHDIDYPIQQALGKLYYEIKGKKRGGGDWWLISEDYLKDGLADYDPDTKSVRRNPYLALSLFGKVERLSGGFGHRSIKSFLYELMHPKEVVHDERGRYRFDHVNVTRFSTSDIPEDLSQSECNTIADLMAIAGSGIFIPQIIAKSGNERDFSNNGYVNDFIAEVLNVTMKTIDINSDNKILRAKWMTALLRFLWAFHKEINKNSTVPFSRVILTFSQSKWINSYAAQLNDEISVLALEVDNGGSWLSDLKSYLNLVGSMRN